jgi:ubiquitin C-terminal hydrolase
MVQVLLAGIDYDESLYMNMKTFWDLFSTGQLTSKVTCTTCGTCSVMEEPFEELLLYFPEDHHTSDKDCTFENLIAHHCGMQDIDNYQCNICNGRMLATKVIAISMCPLILCIVLGRKKQDGRSIRSSVQFPVSGFNIREVTLQYNLVGTIHHKPNGPDHGHYTSICQSQCSQSHNWFRYDDDSVSISNFTTMKNDRVLKQHTKMANILFYVSGALPTCIGSRDAIIYLQDDRTLCSPPEDNVDGTGDKGGGEDDAAPSSSSESELNNREWRGEDDESVLDYRISQEFVQ